MRSRWQCRRKSCPLIRPTPFGKPRSRSWKTFVRSLARSVSHAEYLGPGKLRLVFPAESGMSMRRCDAPDNRAAFVKAVSAIAGEPVFLEYHAAPPKEKPKVIESTAPKPTRMQRMREIEAHPLVKSCVEAFGAEIVKIDRAK